jgi:hypothetical protein
MAARMLHTMFHADLSDMHPGEDHWISVAGQRIPLVPHTETTLKAASAAGPQLYAHRDNVRLTHLSAQTVHLPADTVVRVHLRHSQKNVPGAKSETAISHSAIWYPPAPHLLAALAADATIHAPPIDYVSTAQNFLFHHADVINKDGDLTRIIIEEYMMGDVSIATAINNMANLMRSMGAPSESGGWAILDPYTPPASAPENPKQHFDGKTTYYMQMPTPAVQTEALKPLSPLLVRIQNDPKFKDKKWSAEPGAAVVSDVRPAPRAGTDTPQTDTPSMVHAATIKADAKDGEWQAAVANTGAISGCQTSISVVDAGKKQIKIKMANTYIRYLAGYIRFYGADGKPLTESTWKPDDADLAYDLATELLGVQYDDVRYLGLMSPMNNVLAIPIGPAGTMEVTVTFPPRAVSCSVYGSGLGTGSNPWPKTPALGGVLTGVLNLAVPAFMLGFGVAAQSYKPLYDIIQKLTKNKAFMVAAGAFIATWAAYIIGSSVSHQQMNWSSFTSLMSLIFDKSATAALVWIELDIAGNQLAEQIPFAGWIMLAINIATGIAQMAQTIVEVATSNWNIENSIATTITTAVTVHPDPRHPGVFPAGSKRSCVVKMMYKDQKRPTVQQTITVADDFKKPILAAAFAGNTLGGQVKFEADFYIGTWLAGKATTGYMPNDDVTVAKLNLILVEYPVPLDDKSIYTHAQILTYIDGSYGWTVSKTAPTATITSRDISPTGNVIGDWTGLTLSQRSSMLGLSWQAAGMGIAECDTGGSGQLYAFQNSNIPGAAMDAVKFPSCGFTGQTRLIYDPYPPKFLMDQKGQWVLDRNGRPVPDPKDAHLGEYYVDPRPANLPVDQGGGYHLRKVILDKTTPFDMSKVQPTHGRFAYFPDSVAMHPSGLIIGISAKYQKLQIVNLNREGAPDTNVPLGLIGSGPALDKTRPGLMFYPVAVTCAYDGTIIVLEDTKSSTGTHAMVVSRLSAYDLNMKPVNRFFDGDGAPSPWLYLSNAADYFYLDVTSVGDEQMTYIYILYYTGDGAKPSDYHMAIYTYGKTAPTKNPLVTTNDIAAARLAVDMWHTAYTLNFAMVTDGKGKPAGPKNATTGPAGRTVPSVSMWLPPVPTS